MTKEKVKLEKAYHNREFLDSSSARPIRLLSEFLEPQQQLRREGVRDTIVFFGSARIKSKKVCQNFLKEVKKKQTKSKKLKTKYNKILEDIYTDLNMSRYYEDAVQLSKMLTRWSQSLREPNRFIVCSGGGPGIMEAANKGAILAKGKSLGLNISLPFEQEPNPFITPALNFEFHYFFMRKFWFVYLSKAFIMFPGGFGTMDEMMEVLTLVQTQKLRKKVTMVLYGKDFWNTIINFNALVQMKVISKKDLKLFKIIDKPLDAFNYIVTELQKNYPIETSQT
jgi:uncharacterized protein (TIGR00730 family)